MIFIFVSLIVLWYLTVGQEMASKNKWIQSASISQEERVLTSPDKHLTIKSLRSCSE
jgi:hypothetical protein